MVELAKFVQESYKSTDEWRIVEQLADQLVESLNDEETLRRITDANSPGSSSAEVQAAFRPSAEKLGFESERKGLFAESITGLRPDYFLRLGETGIILEVERGKTTTNNMDLLDFWKCHICEVATYLFLLVPNALQHNPKMIPKREFEVVQRRLSQFFESGKYTNVRGLCLFGY
ncbi:MAG: hypothetical protein IH977_13715 [Nitrospinae bacterium]|nr:hypothetical protein [Nitrospinota bacterium]